MAVGKEDYKDSQVREKRRIKVPKVTLAKVELDNDDKRTRAELLDSIEELFQNTYHAGRKLKYDKDVDLDSLKAILTMLVLSAANNTDDIIGATQDQVDAINLNSTNIARNASDLATFISNISISNNKVGIGTTNPVAKLHIMPSTTIGWSSLGAAGILIGTNTGAGIGIDQNEIASRGDHLYLGTIDANKDLILRAGGTTSYLTLDSSAGTIEAAKNINVTKSSATVKVEESGGADVRIAAGGATGYVGTYSNDSLQLMQNSNVAVTIDTNRRVGIGTTSPSTKLEVISTANEDGIAIKNTSGSLKYKVRHWEQNTYSSFWNASNEEKVRIASGGGSFFNGGNVGIGTTSPNYLLDVEKSGANARIFNTAASTELFLQCASGYVSSINFGDTSDNNAGRIIYREYDHAMTFTTNTSEAMFIDSSQRVGIGTSSPSAKLHVDGNIKLSGNLDIGGSVQKQIQVFPMNFVDDLGTDKHFMPFVTANEQTANYQEEACMVMPADGRVVSVTVHYSQMHGAASDITIGIETSPCGQSYTNAWTIEETETISASADDDHHVFHFAFDNAKHFESTDKMALSIQQSVDLQNANRFFWVTAVIEYDWSTFLGGTSAEHGTTP